MDALNETLLLTLQLRDDINKSDIHAPVHGWVDAGRDRGSIDILWSSLLTIILCVWVSTHPNALSPKDKWYHGVFDKVNLAMIGLLGPDFLFGLAVGQLSSARRSVKQFRKDRHLCGGHEWTYTEAFFLDMGGVFIKTPDFAEGFPIDAEQLHYLVKHGFVDFPDMESMDISERNTVDTLSRLITLWQALWFFITEMDRVRNGLPVTPLELTALSFTFAMVATFVCWYPKPAISYPRYIESKHRDGQQVLMSDIRNWARCNTHPHLPDVWHRTPMDDITPRIFRIDAYWCFYKRLGDWMHLHPYGRPVKSELWDRFPSDLWRPMELPYYPLGGVFIVGFSASFMIGWNFHFPTPAEQLVWRIAASYHMFFSLYGAFHWLYEDQKWHRDQERMRSGGVVGPLPTDAQLESQPLNSEEPKTARRRETVVDRLRALIHSKVNNSVGRDPTMAVPLLVIVPNILISALYASCRVYFYVEDFLSLREQPKGIYLTGNKFLPFVGENW
ncbi:hypothetical protein C8035_v012424 [Colletotrichum spinosum]|uniref:Uncharacterized protein n=1 Tax=Colletotrichum spinosum TaxID=1347390 RepID=A0A4R8Q9H9_9PEZI|nr:hypothetical protein C8035_v012424 [Colletotrichum spinosum]